MHVIRLPKFWLTAAVLAVLALLVADCGDDTGKDRGGILEWYGPVSAAEPGRKM